MASAPRELRGEGEMDTTTEFTAPVTSASSCSQDQDLRGGKAVRGTSSTGALEGWAHLAITANTVRALTMCRNVVCAFCVFIHLILQQPQAVDPSII